MRQREASDFFGVGSGHCFLQGGIQKSKDVVG